MSLSVLDWSVEKRVAFALWKFKCNSAVSFELNGGVVKVISAFTLKKMVDVETSEFRNFNIHTSYKFLKGEQSQCIDNLLTIIIIVIMT